MKELKAIKICKDVKTNIDGNWYRGIDGNWYRGQDFERDKMAELLEELEALQTQLQAKDQTIMDIQNNLVCPSDCIHLEMQTKMLEFSCLPEDCRSCRRKAADNYSSTQENKQELAVTDIDNHYTPKLALNGTLMYSEVSKERMNHKEAIEYAKNLREGGFDDWRLPTVEETSAKVKDGVPSGSYGTWTSTVGYFTHYLWNGTNAISTYDDLSYYVRCVR